VALNVNDTSKRIASVVELSLSPFFKAERFQKRGPHFYKFGDNFIQVVTVQSSLGNTAASGRFRVNFGIHFPAVAEVLLAADPMPQIPKEHYCILRAILLGVHLPWWTVTPTTDVRTIAHALSGHWQDDAWPWMEKNKSLSEAAQTLEHDGDSWSAAAARLVLGEREEAVRLVKAFIVCLESSPEANSPANKKLTLSRLQKIQGWASQHQLMTS